MSDDPWALRFALWIVKRRSSPKWAEFVLGDVEEEFRRRSQESVLNGHLWLLKHMVLGMVVPPPRSRQSPVPRSENFRVRAPRALLREAMRASRARPLFTATCIAILAFGSGTATAVSSAVYSLLLRPLPLPDSQRLVTGFALREGFDPFGTSIVEYKAFRDRIHAFESVGLARQQLTTLRLRSETVRVDSVGVSASYLATAGIHPAFGRTIAADDDRPGAAPVALISHALWVGRLGERPDVLGSSLVFDGRPTTVIGVMPAGFDLPFSADAWFPLQLALDTAPLEQQLASAYSFIGRLRDRITLDQANKEVADAADALSHEYPQRRGWTYRLIGLRQQLIGDIDGSTTHVIALVMAAVVFLLGTCCLNVANLLLLRTTERLRDAAVRLAIGASSRDLALERFTECALIGLVGGGLGMVMALWLAPALSMLHPVRASAFAPVLTSFRVEGPIVFIGGVLSILIAIVIGVVAGARALPAPAELARFVSLGPRTGLGRASKARLRVLVSAQVAVAVLLLIGGGLVTRSFEALRRTDLGFQPQGLISTQLTLPRSAYADHRRRTAELERLLNLVRMTPGVLRAGITTNIPLQHASFDSFYTVEGMTLLNPNDVPITAHRVVTPDYLRLLGVRLVRGRLLTDSDTAEAPRVVVVTEELANQAWPAQDAIGRHIRRGRATDSRPWLTVVGVIANVKEDRFNFRIDRAAWYLPYAQEDSTATPALVVQTTRDVATVAHAIRELVRRFDPDIGLSEPVRLEAHASELLATERFAAALLSALAISGLLLASLGLYGAISHIVNVQRNEIALRIAIGAPRGRVVGMVVGEVARLAVGGVVFGVLLARIGSEGLRSLLFQVQPVDAATHVAVAFVLVLAGVLAACGPAVRAVSVDPARLLR